MSKKLSRGVERGNLAEYPQRDEETKDIFEDVDRKIDLEVADVMKAVNVDPNESVPSNFFNIEANKDRLQYTVFSELKNRVYSNEMLDKMKEKYKTFQAEKSDKNLADIYRDFFGKVVKPVVLSNNLKPKVLELLADKIDIERNKDVVDAVIMDEVEKDLAGRRKIRNIRGLANQVLINVDTGEMKGGPDIAKVAQARKPEGLGRTPQMKMAADKFREGVITPAEFSQYVRLEEALKIVKAGGEVENWEEIKKAGEAVMEKIAGKKIIESSSDEYMERYDKIADMLADEKINFAEYQFLADNLFKLRDGKDVPEETLAHMKELESR